MDLQKQGPAPGQATPEHAPPQRGPGLVWIAVSWALGAVLVVIGFSGFFSALSGVIPSTTFVSGERVTVALDPADEPRLYVTRPGVPVNCQLLGPRQEGLALTNATGPQIVSNGRTWYPVFDITVPARGEYQLACVSESDLTIGVGTAPGAAVMLSPPLAGLGLLAAVTTTIVVLVKRRSARRWY
jgi:hypothetical protein